MKIHLISDNTDTQTGLRLAGVSGVVAHTREELKKELEAVLNDPEIGVLIIMERLAQSFPDIIDEIRLNRRLPLVVEIPDRHGTGRRPDFIEAYIRDAIGVKL